MCIRERGACSSCRLRWPEQAGGSSACREHQNEGDRHAASVSTRVVRRLWEHLRERLDLDAVENPVDHIGIARHNFPHRRARGEVNDDQAAAAVGERPGEDDLARLRQRFEVPQVRRTVLRALFLCVGSVVADDDEERKRLLSCNSGSRLYPVKQMSHKHVETIPVALESVITRLGELEVVLGAPAGAVVAAVRSMLIAAMAARDRGDQPAAVGLIGQAMERLAALANGLDPAEATMMRALAQNFRAALLSGDAAQAQRSAALMFEKSGATPRKKA
jgi:hypothetical protein